MSTISKDTISRPIMKTFNSWDSIDQRVVEQMEAEQEAKRRASVAWVPALNISKGKQKDLDVYDSSKRTENPFIYPPIPPIPSDFLTQTNSRPSTSRAHSLKDRDIIELKAHIAAIQSDRARDLESQVRIQTQQYRMGWRSVLQIGSAFVSTCTLAIAITNLTDRLQREAKMMSP